MPRVPAERDPLAPLALALMSARAAQPPIVAPASLEAPTPTGAFAGDRRGHSICL
jgi:hypothetical protein